MSIFEIYSKGGAYTQQHTQHKSLQQKQQNQIENSIGCIDIRTKCKIA
jgi:hypothetical protein